MELHELGDYERSARAFQRSAEGSEHPVDSLYNLTQARKGKHDAALMNLEKAPVSGFGKSAKEIRRHKDYETQKVPWMTPPSTWSETPVT